MKVYTRVVIDWDGRIVEEDSFEYFGPVAECKGGGGGGGAGRIEYPTYMQTAHGDWLNDAGADTIEASVTAVMNTALGASPWTGEVAYSPDAELSEMAASVATFQTLITLLSSGTGLDTLVSNVLDTSRIDAVITAYGVDIDARLESEVYPRFEAGMRDINAVVSSAFVIGRANIVESRNREVEKFSSSLRLKAATDDSIKLIMLKLEYQKTVTQTLLEARRMKIVAKKEERDQQLSIDESDAKWDLEVFQYGSNVMASVGGGTDSPAIGKKHPVVSALGGALSGAAAGAMVAGASGGAIAGPVGILMGAGIGLGAALLGG